MSETHINTYDHLSWREESRKPLVDCGIFEVLATKRSSLDGKEGEFVLVDARDWVTVLPILPSSSGELFLMVRQFRHGSARITLEFPAGVIRPGEPPKNAAARELLEETGFTAGSMIEIGSINPNPAFMTNTVHSFVATNLTHIQAPQFDEHEMIESITLPVEEVVQSMGKGEYSSGIMMIALAWFLRWSGRVKSTGG